jgi:hypothetical protein
MLVICCFMTFGRGRRKLCQYFRCSKFLCCTFLICFLYMFVAPPFVWEQN